MRTHLISIVLAAVLGAAAACIPNSSQAASCCGGGSAASLSVPKYAVAVADLSFDTELYDGYWDQKGSHRPDPPESDLKQFRLNVGLGYRFAKDWQASISLPYVWNDNTYSGTSSRSDGLGDTTVSISYDLLDDKSSWKIYEAKDLIPAITVGMSLLIPTGISPYDDKNSSFDITGRGFYRLDGMLLVEKSLRPWNMSLSLAYGTYFDRSVNREYGKYVEPYTKGLGDRFTASASAGYTFIYGTGGDSITTTASYAYLNEGNASYNGIQASDSGFDKQSLGIAAAYSSTDHNWGLRLGWNHAIQQNGWGHNFPTTDVVSVGVRYVFL